MNAAPKRSIIGVNVGCGSSPTLGFANFDNSLSVYLGPRILIMLYRMALATREQVEFAERAARADVLHADVRRGLPVEPASVRVVYSCHMLEHLEPAEARLALIEFYRILLPGGFLRLVVPDLALLVRQYRHSGDANAFIARTQMSGPSLRSWRARLTLLGGSRHHRWMYDGASLTRLVVECGFRDPVLLGPGKTTIGEPTHIDLREREEESLYLECRKP